MTIKKSTNPEYFRHVFGLVHLSSVHLTLLQLQRDGRFSRVTWKMSSFSLFPEPPTSCQVYTKEGSRILSCWALLVCCVYLLCQRLFICGVAGIWSGVSSGLKWQVGSYRCTVDTGIKNESLTGDYSLWVSGCHQSFWEKVDVYSQNPAVFVTGETRKESLCDTICVIIYIFKGHFNSIS